jgi:hypothetical protein
MTQNGNPNLLIVGYPRAGKTTYLAALWYVVNHADELRADLRLHRLEGNDAYLNMIQNQWLGYQEVERTKLSQEASIFFEVENSQNGNIFGLSIPDLSGERFRQHFEERHCTNEYADLVANASGCLFFIHSGQIRKSVPIVAAQPTLQYLATAPTADTEFTKEDTAQEERITWDRTMSSTQVKSVELLQFIMYLRASIRPLRIALVLSAWDLVESLQKTPSAYLKEQLPLLHQFLMANSERLSAQVYGISALGIDLGNRVMVERFAQNIYNQTDRISVRCADSIDASNDITLPIRWII